MGSEMCIRDRFGDVWLPQDGLGTTNVRDHIWRGIFVGLERDDAGPDWGMVTVPGQEQVQASVAIANAAGTATLTLTLDAGAAGGIVDGEDGNNANVSAVSSGADTVTIDTSGPTTGKVLTVRIWVNALTFDQVAALANAQAGLTAAVTGDGSLVFPTPGGSMQDLYDFSGGLDAQEMGVAVDAARKVVELTHLTGHLQPEIVAFLDGRRVDASTVLHARLLRGSRVDRGISNAPLDRAFLEMIAV